MIRTWSRAPMSDKIRFPCPQCRHILKASPEHAGRKGSCTRCGATFTIPGGDETADHRSIALAGTAPTAQPTSTFLDLASLPELNEAVERLTREGEATRLELERARDEAAALREELDLVRGDQAQTEATRAERDRLQAELDRAGDELAKLRSETDDLRSRLEQARSDAASDLARLGQEAREARATWDAERQSLVADWEGRWRQAESDARRLGEDAGRWERELQSARAGSEDLRVQHRKALDDLEAVRGEFAAARAGSEALERQIHEARSASAGEKARLDAELLAARQESEAHRARADAAHAELETLRGECQRLRTDGTRLDEALREIEAAQRAQAEEHCREVAQWHDKHQEASQQAEAHRRLAEGFRGELETARRQGDEATRAAVEALDAHRREREAERSELEALSRRLQTDVADARSAQVQAVAEVEGRLHSASERAEQLTRDLEEAGSARSRLEKELTEARTVIGDLREQVAEANTFRHQIRTLLAGLGIKLPS
jgi:chromosome segregation ATPase